MNLLSGEDDENTAGGIIGACTSALSRCGDTVPMMAPKLYEGDDPLDMTLRRETRTIGHLVSNVENIKTHQFLH